MIAEDSNVEVLQDYLRHQKRQDEEQSAPPPPNPTTPYDDVGQVQMSMRILTDEGEEKDLFQLMPKESEEEKWRPKSLECQRAGEGSERR